MTVRRGLGRVRGRVTFVAGAIMACAGPTMPPPRAPPAAVERPAATPAPTPQASSEPSARAVSHAEGVQVFFTVCGPCHLALWHLPPGGTLGPPERSEEEVRRRIRRGSLETRGAMPAIDERALPEASMGALMEHLRSIGVVARRRAAQTSSAASP